MSNKGGGSKNYIAVSFQAFLEAWLVRQEHYLDELLSVQTRLEFDQPLDADLKELVSRIVAHYQQYYEEKSRVAHQDVFLVFSPTWFTTFERSLLWIAGFKPGLAFQIVTNSVGDMSDEQREKMKRLIVVTRAEERTLHDELAKIQESIAAPPIIEVARRNGRLNTDDDETNKEDVFMALKSRLGTLLVNADSLRTNTLLKLVEMFRPDQNIRFMVAATQLQLRIRTWGLRIDAERNASH